MVVIYPSPRSNHPPHSPCLPPINPPSLFRLVINSPNGHVYSLLPFSISQKIRPCVYHTIPYTHTRFTPPSFFFSTSASTTSPTLSYIPPPPQPSTLQLCLIIHLLPTKEWNGEKKIMIKEYRRGAALFATPTHRGYRNCYSLIPFH